METLSILNESDFKRWVKEAVREYFQGSPLTGADKKAELNVLMNRKKVAKLLQVSLVTLTNWMKKGLPFYKQHARVYFIKSEVIGYIQKNNCAKGNIFSNNSLDL